MKSTASEPGAHYFPLGMLLELFAELRSLRRLSLISLILLTRVKDSFYELGLTDV